MEATCAAATVYAEEKSRHIAAFDAFIHTCSARFGCTVDELAVMSPFPKKENLSKVRAMYALCYSPLNAHQGSRAPKPIPTNAGINLNHICFKTILTLLRAALDGVALGDDQMVDDLYAKVVVRCAFYDRYFHSRVPLILTPARLKLLHATPLLLSCMQPSSY
jgi:hypothetical protein